MDNRERFLMLGATVKRDGMEELLEWLAEKTDFFEARSTAYAKSTSLTDDL